MNTQEFKEMVLFLHNLDAWDIKVESVVLDQVCIFGSYNPYFPEIHRKMVYEEFSAAYPELLITLGENRRDDGTYSAYIRVKDS